MKRAGYYFIILCGAVITGCVVFVGTLSIWIGIAHQHENGYLTPVLAGAFASLLVLFLFFRVSAHLLRHIRRTDSVNL